MGDKHAKGRDAEDAVADYLRVRGFVVTGRNLRFGALELDIVAERGALAIVVEVRTRGATAFDSPLSSIGHEKKRHLLRAARKLWRERLRSRREIERVRIDVAGVRFEDGVCSITYVQGAIVGGMS